MNAKLLERYKGKVVCDHAETCGNEECFHGWPHEWENVRGCHCTGCSRAKGGLSNCRPFAELAAEREATQ